MDAGIAQAALQDAGCLQGLAFEGGFFRQLLDVVDHLQSLVASEFFLQRFVIEREKLFEADVGHQLGNTIRVRQRQFKHPGRVADGAFRGHAAVGDDLSDLVRAVFVNDVVDDLSAALVIEVNVDIG